MAAKGVDTASYDRLKELKEFDESKIGCKGLADSGITKIPRIFHHPPESLPKFQKYSQDFSSASLTEIPVIALSGLDSPAGRKLVVDQVRHVAAALGFFQILDHIEPNVENISIGKDIMWHCWPAT